MNNLQADGVLGLAPESSEMILTDLFVHVQALVLLDVVFFLGQKHLKLRKKKYDKTTRNSFFVL